MERAAKRCGLTLIELVIVVAILAILAAGVVPMVSHHAADARQKAANASLVEIRNAIMGTPESPGFFADTDRLPNSLDELLNKPNDVPMFDRDSAHGWRGPYLVSSPIDPWGNPIILQIPTSGSSAAINNSFARLISAGPNGNIDTPQNTLDALNNPYPGPAQRGDDIVLFLHHSDSDP